MNKICLTIVALTFAACSASKTGSDTLTPIRALSSSSLIYKCEPERDSWAMNQQLEIQGTRAQVSSKDTYSHKGENFVAERDDSYQYFPDSRDKKDKVVFTKSMDDGGKALIFDVDMLSGANSGSLKVRYYQTEYPADRDGTKNVTYKCTLK